MMKKKGRSEISNIVLISLILVFILSLPQYSYALVSFDDISKDVYSIGEKISVKGYILEEFDAQGTFELNLECGSETRLKSRSIKISKGSKYSFSEELTIPSSSSGDCDIKGVFIYNATLQDSSQSSSFTVSKDLDGNFSVNKERIQLGQPVKISGKIVKVNGQSLNGLAEIYFKQGEELKSLESLSITDGKLDYDFLSAYPGDYQISVYAKDLFGNEKTFENILSFSVDDKLLVEAELPKESYKPLEKILVKGKVSTTVDYILQNPEINIIFNEKIYKTKLSGKTFSYEIIIPENIKSGSHELIVRAQDNSGNKGSVPLKVSITQVPTSLLAQLQTTKIKPGMNLSLSPTLYDQANDLMMETITVQILDPDKKVISELSTNSGDKTVLEIPNFLAPGNYVVRSESAGIKREEKFTVEDLQRLDYKINGTIVKITNLGNIAYNDNVALRLTREDGKELALVKRVSIAPDSSIEINLNKELPGASYSLSVPEISQDSYQITTKDERSFFKKAFGNSVTGATVNENNEAKKSSPALMIWSIIIIIGLVGSFVYYNFFAGKIKAKEYSDDLSPEEAEKLNEILRNKKLAKSKSQSDKEINLKHPERHDPAIQKFVQESLKKAEEVETKNKISDQIEESLKVNEMNEPDPDLNSLAKEQDDFKKDLGA